MSAVRKPPRPRWSLLAGLLLLALLLGLAGGQGRFGPAELWSGLWTGEGPAGLTLRHIRGPGVAAALGVGAVFGISGAIFQSLLRNPLAAPDVLGFSSGAGLATIGAVALGLSLPPTAVAAFGGLAAAALVALLAAQPGAGREDALTLVLVGLGVGFFASAASGFLLIGLPPREAMEAQRWLTGSLAAPDWPQVGGLFGAGALLTLALAPQVRALGLLEMGEDLASGLGLKPRRARLGLAATGVLFAAAGVAMAGPVPFVALMAGPIGARLVGARGPGERLAAAAGGGALTLVLADLAARAAIPGTGLPVGVATGIFGAPYLLWLLNREMRKGGL